MMAAMAEGRRVLKPSGVGVVVFAHKSTVGWEAMLQALVDAGAVIMASWPIDTEMASRLRAQNSATLASSVHIVFRPREMPDGSLRKEDVGDWREVLRELPKRIHEWMPKLAEEPMQSSLVSALHWKSFQDTLASKRRMENEYL
jgi:adenine-specific DNA methylase